MWHQIWKLWRWASKSKFGAGAGISGLVPRFRPTNLPDPLARPMIQSIVTLEPLHPLQVQRLRAMSFAEKWEVAKGLLRTARQTCRAGIALRHPDWTPQQIEKELAREFARART